jgi:two-component system, OmpR family, response regulator
MNPHTHLLLLEDDTEISGMVSNFMTDHGFHVLVAANGQEFDRVIAENPVDLVLLDLMLPGDSGLSICKRIRSASTIPVIMLTALGSEADGVAGLELGADDYITKPFSARELLARVRAVLRRSQWFDVPERKPNSLTFDRWSLDLTVRKLRSPEGLQVALTTAEFTILSVFCQHAGQILSREQLLDLAYSRTPTLFDRSIDVQVSRLRRKIEVDPKDPTMIITVRNGGYMFTPTVAATAATQ